MPLKYTVDSISLLDTQQTAYDLLAQGGKLAIFLPTAAKTTKDKEIFSIHGFLRETSNIELLETLLHDNLEQLLKEGTIKVSRNRKCPPIYDLTDWIT